MTCLENLREFVTMSHDTNMTHESEASWDRMERFPVWTRRWTGGGCDRKHWGKGKVRTESTNRIHLYTSILPSDSTLYTLLTKKISNPKDPAVTLEESGHTNVVRKRSGKRTGGTWFDRKQWWRTRTPNGRIRPTGVEKGKEKRGKGNRET